MPGVRLVVNRPRCAPPRAVRPPLAVYFCTNRVGTLIRKALLSAPAVADAAGPGYSALRDWLAEHRFALDEGLRRLAAAERAAAIAGESIEVSVLRVPIPARPAGHAQGPGHGPGSPTQVGERDVLGRCRGRG